MEDQITGARERERLHRALADELRQNRFIDMLTLEREITVLTRIVRQFLLLDLADRY